MSLFRFDKCCKGKEGEDYEPLANDNVDVESNNNYGAASTLTKTLALIPKKTRNNNVGAALNIVSLSDSSNLFSASSLAFPQGSITVIVGPSGCGKSIFTTSIVGINNLVANRNITVADFNGEETNHLSFASFRSKVAFVPQDLPHLSDATAMNFFEEVIGYKAVKARARSIGIKRERELYCARLKENASLLNLDVCDLDEKNLAELSGGMRQRIFIAMVFSLHFRIIILDEPTSALDDYHTQIVENFIVAAATRKDKPVTVIMTSHDMKQKDRLADFVIDMT